MKIPFGLIFAHSKKTWPRTLLTVISVFVTVLIFGVLRVFVAGLDAAALETSKSRLIVSSAISLFAHLPARIQGELRDLPGVDSVTHWTWYGGTYIDDSPEHKFWARFGVDMENFRKVYGSDLEMTEDEWTAFVTTPTGCIVGAELAKAENLKLGQKVPMTGNLFGGKVDLTLVGIWKSKVASFDEKTLFFNWKYMNEEAKKAEGRQDVVSTYTLLLKNPDDAPKLMQQIDGIYESSGNRTKTQTERQFQQGFNSMWGQIPFYFAVIGGVVMIACLFVTANTMLLNARERIQEVGVLKTLGFAPKVISLTTLIESLMLCLIGGGLAMLLVKLLDGKRLMFIVADAPFSLILEGILIAVALGLFSGIVPALSAGRMNIVTAIRRRA